MRWEDERYVKVFTRDTAEWIALGWEAQSLFLAILRKVDRAGILTLGKTGPRGLAGVTRFPVEVVERALPILLEDGCVQCGDGALVVPNFIVAQETSQSDKARQREKRERDRTRVMDGADVTKRDGESQNVTAPSRNVTESHAPSRAVTRRHAVSLLTVPNHTEEERDVVAGPGDVPGPLRGAGVSLGASPDPEDGEEEQEPAQGTLLLAGAAPARRPARRDVAAEVHEAYLDGWERYVGKGSPPTLDDKRRKLINARAKDFSPEQLVAVARGAWASEWHREDPGKRMRLDQIFANTGRVEQFLAKAEQATKPALASGRPDFSHLKRDDPEGERLMVAPEPEPWVEPPRKPIDMAGMVAALEAKAREPKLTANGGRR